MSMLYLTFPLILTNRCITSIVANIMLLHKMAAYPQELAIVTTKYAFPHLVIYIHLICFSLSKQTKIFDTWWMWYERISHKWLLNCFELSHANKAVAMLSECTCFGGYKLWILIDTIIDLHPVLSIMDFSIVAR